MAKKKSEKAFTQPLANGGSTTSLEDNMTNLALGGVILDSPSPTRPSGKRIKNIVREFERYFGNDTKLENWVRLCRDVGIEGELTSINKCRQALKRIWVNIHDLINAVRNHSTPPQRFPNQRALAAYTIEHERYYPKKKAKEGGPVRLLLAHIL